MNFADSAWLVVPASTAFTGYRLALAFRRGRAAAHHFWGGGAAALATVWALATLYVPIHGSVQWAEIHLTYGPSVIICAVCALRGWRQANRPGWYGGQHERIDNP